MACSIPGCTRKVRAKGMCNSHYLREWRHGDASHGRALVGDALSWLLETAAYTGDECRLWPFGVVNTKAGAYGSVRHAGRTQLASHVVCGMAHGPAPAGKPHAAHRCHKTLCCTPRHVRWASCQENQADRLADGTACIGERHPQAKLTEEAVRHIRLHNDAPLAAVAAHLQVSVACIKAVRYGKTWSHVQ